MKHLLIIHSQEADKVALNLLKHLISIQNLNLHLRGITPAGVDQKSWLIDAINQETPLMLVLLIDVNLLLQENHLIAYIQEHEKSFSDILGVLVGSCVWEENDFLKTIQIYPENQKPLSEARNEDKFYANLARQISDINKGINLIDPESTPVGDTTPDSDSQARYLEVIDLISNEKWQEVLKVLAKAIVLEPKSARLFNAQGLAYSKIKEFNRAITSFEKAHQLDPESWAVNHNLGLHYIDAGDKTRGCNCLKKAAETHHESRLAFQEYCQS